MGAHVIQLADYRARKAKAANAPAELDGATDIAGRFHFWSGASGRRYVHTIYSLIECPALPAGNYVLVRREANGVRNVLSVGRVSNESASLNLAEIRKLGAELEANEVHVHLLAHSVKQSMFVEADLRTGQGRGTGTHATH
jgi:hypothetical protein